MDVGSNGSGGGNTNPPPLTQSKRQNGAKRWPWTWNNYPSNWMDLLAPAFHSCDWVAGYEIGDSGTKHIQGYTEWPKKIRPIGYKGLPKTIHWGDAKGKPARGTRAENIAYCLKDGDKAGGNLSLPRQLPNITLTGWQLAAAAKCDREPDNRAIFWYWSDKGKRGKSSFVRWLVMEKGALICSGKAADMKFLIAKYIKDKEDYPYIVVFDVTRENADYLSYTGIEEIKNGVFCSPKYESSSVCMPYVHIFVMANFPPNMTDEKMSHDRYEVVNVDDHSGEQTQLSFG